MRKLRKLFFETPMTWPRVLIFAVATAAVTALLLRLPFTAGTSFANMGTTLECWILFALLIIINCEKPPEAGVKTFVFFLVSQPLIYLFQVPFYADGFAIFRYYSYWFWWTVACLPGGMLAWFVKKGNLWSALILSVATGYLGVQGICFLGTCIRHFPHDLISVIFIALLTVVLILVLLPKKRERLVAGAITLAVTLAAVWFTFFAEAPAPTAGYYLGDEHTWTVTATEGDAVGDITIDPDWPALTVKGEQYGTAEVTLTNEDGETVTFTVTYEEADGLSIEQKE